MGLSFLQTRIITQANAPSGSLSGFIAASLNTVSWNTTAPLNLNVIKSVALSLGPTSCFGLGAGRLYVGSGKVDSTLFIFDVSNSSNPVLKNPGGTAFPIAGNPVTQLRFRTVAVIGTTVYLSDGANVFTIVNASDPTAPTLVSHPTVAAFKSGILAARGSLVYVLGNNPGNTANLLGVCNGSLAVQGSVSFDTGISGSYVNNLVMNFPTVFTLTGPDFTHTHLRAIDVSIPTAPAVVGGPVTVPGLVDMQPGNQVLAVDGTMLYVLGSNQGNPGSQNVFQYDVSDRTNPTLANTFPITDSLAAVGLQNLFVAGGVINMTAGTGPVNLVVYDTSGNLVGSAQVSSAITTINPAIQQIV